MLQLFKKKKNGIASPVNGTCIPLEKVNDKVFSSKMMGDGFAVIPESNEIVSPVDGEIVLIPKSKHAFGIKAKNGIEVLVHIGLDTVNLNGEGFKRYVSVNDKVKQGDLIISFDSEFMKKNNIDLTTMVILTSGYEEKFNIDCFEKKVKQGELVIQ